MNKLEAYKMITKIRNDLFQQKICFLVFAFLYFSEMIFLTKTASDKTCSEHMLISLINLPTGTIVGMIGISFGFQYHSMKKLLSLLEDNLLSKQTES